MAISSSSLATPLPPAHWEETVSQRREMWREMLGVGDRVRVIANVRQWRPQ